MSQEQPQYTASVIGAGTAGHLALAALTASERFRSVAVADLRPEAFEKLTDSYPHLRTFTSHERMFEQCPTDVVCIATYAPSHLPLTLAALERLPRLKGIVVEKPLGDTTAAGRRIIDAVRARGIPMAVPHGLLVAPHSTEILSRVRGGEIGALRLVSIENDKWDILNAGIHWLNFFVALTGNEPVDWVLAAADTTTRTYRDGLQVETMAVTYAATRSGVRVVMNTGDFVPTSVPGKGCVFHLVGTRGTIEFYAWEPTYRLVNTGHPDGKVSKPAGDGRGNHQRHFEILADQIDRGETDYAVAESSLAALELCEAAYLSHRHRCMVKLPLATFTPPSTSGNDWDPGRPYAGTGGGRDGRRLE